MGAALEAAWRRENPGGPAAAPRLLVCEKGAGILVCPREFASAARAALSKHGGSQAVRLAPIVTSGTIATVKQRLHLAPKNPRARG